jgi:WD40 repeat protein
MDFDDEESVGHSRRQREEVLRALAQGATTSMTPTQAEQRPALATAALEQPTRRRRLHWLIPLMSILALVAVVALAVAHLLPNPAPKTRQATAELALDPLTYGIACLQNAAWSPDSTKLAILGQQQNCAMPIPQQYSYYPTLIVIIEATTGKKLGQLMPDVTVQNDLHLRAPQYITPVNGLANSGDLTQQGVAYEGMVWSPDGKNIALPFFLNYATKPFTGSPAADGSVAVSGLFIGAVDGSGAHAFAVDQADAPRFAGEWNVKSGKSVLMPKAPPINNYRTASWQLLPASLEYTWRADGTLVGSDQLSAVNPPARRPLSPVGNPDGGDRFTVWQPMHINQSQGDPAHQVDPAPFVALASFLAWSPDGTYLLQASIGPWRIQPSKQPVLGPAQLKAAFADNLPILPIRDAALNAMLNPASDKPGGFTSSDFAWSPDGKMLAARVNGGADGNDTYLILDCATARTLATIHVNSASNAYGNLQSEPGMMWSPDGKRLLVGSLAELFILGPGKLPQG